MTRLYVHVQVATDGRPSSMETDVLVVTAQMMGDIAQCVEACKIAAGKQGEPVSDAEWPEGVADLILSSLAVVLVGASEQADPATKAVAPGGAE